MLVVVLITLLTCFTSCAKSNKWQRHITVWSNFIDHISEKNVNISIVGWQHLYDDEGDIKAINSVELVVKDKARFSNQDDHISTSERSNLHQTLKDFSPFIDLIKKGIQVDIWAQQNAPNDEIVDVFYWNQNTTYYKHKHFVTYNKTQTGSFQTAEEFLKSLNASQFKTYNRSFYLEPIVIKYDNKGIIDFSSTRLEISSIVGYVLDSSNVPDQVLLKSPLIFAQIILQHPSDQIPQQLVKRSDQEFTQFDWNVVVNPKELEVIKDVYITLSTDPFDFYHATKDEYFVYGVQRHN